MTGNPEGWTTSWRVQRSIDRCQFEHRIVSAPNGKHVLLFYVPFSATRVVCTSSHEAYRRVGKQTLRLSEAEIRELRYARRERDFESELAAPYSPELLHPDLVRSYIDGRVRRNGLTLDIDPLEALQTGHLLEKTKDGPYLTHAAILALGRQPTQSLPGARVRFLRFEGTEERVGARRNVIKDRWLDGPIPYLLVIAREFIRTQVREFDHLGPDSKFVTEPEYPEDAWEEALVNALVHRSYSLTNAAIFVRMFDDRLEFESPGGFPGTVTAQNLFSYPRNPRLAGALQYLDLVRLAREGTRRMQSSMVALGLPEPEFEELDGSRVRVILRNDIERRRARDVGGQTRAAWNQVASLLQEEFAIYRRRALESWQALHREGHKAPPAVLDAALRIVENRLVSPDEALQMLGALSLEERASVETRLIGGFTDGLYRERGDLGYAVLAALHESDSATRTVLSWLERAPPGSREVDDALRVLSLRLSRGVLPPRDWIEQAVRACRAHSESRTAQIVFQEITGKPLTP